MDRWTAACSGDLRLCLTALQTCLCLSGCFKRFHSLLPTGGASQRKGESEKGEEEAGRKRKRQIGQKCFYNRQNTKSWFSAWAAPASTHCTKTTHASMLLTPTFFHYIYGLCFASFFILACKSNRLHKPPSVLEHIYTQRYTLCTCTKIVYCALFYKHKWHGLCTFKQVPHLSHALPLLYTHSIFCTLQCLCVFKAK